jgi:hypothetical protein
MRSHIRPISLLFTTLFLSLIFINPAWVFECTDACKQTHLATGSLRVERGTRAALEPPGDEAETPALLRRIAGAVLDFLVPSARAATEGASNNFFGTGAGANNSGDNNSFFGGSAGSANTTGSANAFFGLSAGLSNTTGVNNAFFGTFAGLFNTTGFDNAFFGTVAGGSNTTGFDNAFFGPAAGIDNTTGFENAFFGTFAGVSNTTGFNNAFFGAFSDGAAGISNATALGNRARVEQSNAMVLGSIPGLNSGTDYVDVGIGTSMPQAPLHVERADGAARVLVMETEPGPSMPFQGVAQGLVRFELNDEAAGERWRFTNAGDKFAINNVGLDSPGTEMSVFKNGDLVIGGLLTENSDVNAKQDIVPVNRQDVLAKIAQLPIAEWSYEDAPGQRHMGPMAQDFHAAFGLGRDNKHIATLDTSGVALAGIQALAEENHRVTAEYRRIAEENQDLRQRLELLENIVSGLIERQQRVAATNAVTNAVMN